jgi:pyridoxal phosphate enzyme (YggS family)
MHNIEKNLDRVNRQIAAAAADAGRSVESITLLAVSKTKPIENIITAYQHGQRSFGENYLQEAENKIRQLAEFDIEWHFIGPLQSNKTRRAAELFDWIHTIDRLKIARRLAEQRPPGLPPLNVLLQVNIEHEASKSGVLPDQVLELANQVAEMPGLRLRGLMAIPAIHEDYAQQCVPFAAMQKLMHDLQQQHPHCDTLSMGMTADMSAAIAHGATLVRIGTAIFGAREPRIHHD